MYKRGRFRKKKTNPSLANSLSIINFNARSIPKHKSDIEIMLNAINYNADLITIEETWLDNNLEQLAHISGYGLITKHKKKRKEGGGLAIYIKNNLQYTIRTDLFFPEEITHKMDCLFITVKDTTNKDITIGTIYRSPSYPTEQTLTDNLAPIIDIISKEKGEIIICGDPNIDLLKINDSKTNNFTDLFISKGLIPKITLPTRVTRTSATLIDHIFHRNNNNETVAGTITNKIADHYTNFILLKQTDFHQPIPSHPKTITSRKLNSKNISTINRALLAQNWDTVLQTQDTDTAYDATITLYNTVLDTHAPLKTEKFKRHKHKIKNWITKSIIVSINTRNDMHKKMLNEKNCNKKIK